MSARLSHRKRHFSRDVIGRARATVTGKIVFFSFLQTWNKVALYKGESQGTLEIV